MTYDTLPIKTLCKILQDESKIEDYNITIEQWNDIKEQYNLAHPSQEDKAILDLYSKVMGQDVNANKYIILLKIIKQGATDLKGFFEAAKVRYTGDLEKDVAYLNKQISKSKQIATIEQERLRKLTEEIKERARISPPEPLTDKKINEALASMELAGFTIDNYDTITCGKYDAITQVLSKKASKNGK